jgi:hypothetical protein
MWLNGVECEGNINGWASASAGELWRRCFVLNRNVTFICFLNANSDRFRGMVRNAPAQHPVWVLHTISD